MPIAVLVYYLRIMFRLSGWFTTATRRASARSVQENIDDHMDTARVEIESLKAALRDKEAEILRCRGQEKVARQGAESFQHRLEQAEQAMKKNETEHEMVLARLFEVMQNLSQAENFAQQTKSHAVELQRTISAQERELQKTGTLLDTKSAELREAQAYLTIVDDISDRDILNIVENLDDRIYQTAATIAYGFGGHYDTQQDLEIVEQASERLASPTLLGPHVVPALRSINHNEESVLVQTALQAVMVAASRRLCDAWASHVAGPLGVLREAYWHIREREPQSVSGRWRTLALTHINALLARNADLQSVYEGELAGHVSDVLLACGVPGTPQAVAADIKNRFSAAIHEIVRLSLEFRHVTGEKIISRDLCAFIAEPETIFDPVHMVDGWADPRSRLPQSGKASSILCTTKRGLVREEGRASEYDGGKMEIQRTVLLKPEVVLTSMLDELRDVSVGVDGASERRST